MSLSWLAGERITADKLNARLTLVVTKSSSENVTSSTTIQDDDELFLTLPANRVYRIVALIIVPATASTAGDIKTAWSTTGTLSTGVRTVQAPAAAVTSNADTTMRVTAHGTTTEVASGTAASGNTGFIEEQFQVTTGASGGTLRFRWAQNASNATATTVQSGSYILAIPVE